MTNKEWICVMASRSLIGDFRNMANDCIENLRPRAQYLHFYRSSRKKIIELQKNWCIDKTSYWKCLNDILDYLNSTNKANHNNQIEISNSIIKILNNYNLNVESKSDKREIGY